MIAIVNYGAGNFASVKKALDSVGAKSVVTQDANVIRGAEKIVLPGVGHFAATRSMDGLGLRAPIGEAISAGVPFLGICVGMQWMFGGSTEAPGVPGLGVFSGVCDRFPAQVKSPHVGWNRMRLRDGSRSKLLRGINNGSAASDASGPYVYYTHSYRVPAAADLKEITATSEYGGEFVAVVEKDNIFGIQFHVEKSADAGLHILRNFVGL